ncbi:MAG: hypothetical protein ACR2JF_17475 [Iamia sp.]
MVLVVLAAEAGLRVIDGHLPRQISGDSVEIELKYDQLRALAAADDPVDVVVLGNSTLDAATEPTLLGQVSRRFDAPYNAALLGAPLTAIRRWATDYVLMESDPDTVVLGLTPLDVPTVGIFGVGKPAVADQFEQSLDRLAPSQLQRTDDYLSDHSTLVRRRGLFRAPGELWRGLSDTVHDRDKEFEGEPPVTFEDGSRGVRDRATWEQDLLAPRGGIRTYWGAEFDGTSDRRVGAIEREAFATSNVDRLQLTGVVDAIEDAGVGEVVIVIPPHDRSALAATGLDLDQFDRLSDQLVAFAEDRQMAVLDLSRAQWDHADFFDPAHLSKQGSDRFTRWLARQLDVL